MESASAVATSSPLQASSAKLTVTVPAALIERLKDLRPDLELDPLTVGSRPLTLEAVVHMALEQGILLFEGKRAAKRRRKP